MSEVLNQFLASVRQARDVSLALLFRGVTGSNPHDLATDPNVVKALGTLAPFRDLPAQRVVANATPFVWLNARRLHECLQETGSQAATAARRLAISAFDAFYDELADGTSIQLEEMELSAIVLPRLQVYLAEIPSRGVSVLTRAGACKLVVEDAGGSTQVDLDTTASRAFFTPIQNAPHALLLRIRDPLLFERSYYNSILPTGEGSASFADSIGRALDLVGRCDAALADRIRHGITFYVPISSPDDSTHCSFSSPQLAGVTFLSETDDDLRLAEAIVHEFGHTELDKLLSVEALFESDGSCLYYSPWRPDARPLRGLFHALYVFSEVLRFLLRVNETQPGRKQDIRERARVVTHRMRLGLMQLPRERLTPHGRELMEEAEEVTTRGEFELQVTNAPLPSMMKEHLHLWMQNYPELKCQVELPASFLV